MTTAIQTNIAPLSQSRRELMRCAHLYRARILQGMPEAQNEPALRGNQIHKGASDYVDHLVKTRQSSDPDFFERQILTRPYLSEALELLEEAEKVGIFKIDPERVLGTEMYLALNEDMEPIEEPLAEPEYGGSPQTAYEGTLDRVDVPTRETAIINDYKSQFQIVDAEDHYQALHYALLIFKHYRDIETVQFILHFLRYGTASRDVVFHRSDLPAMEKMVKRERDRQLAFHNSESFDFQASPGTACTYCPLLSGGCPVSGMNPYTDLSPADRASYKLYLIAAMKQNDQVLRDFCNIDPIRVKDANGKDYEVGYRLVEKGAYKAVEVLPILTANDPELAQKVMLSGLSTPLKAKKRFALQAMLSEYRVVKQSTRFGVSGVEEPNEFEEY